jgi:hypothetical protein
VREERGQRTKKPLNFLITFGLQSFEHFHQLCRGVRPFGVHEKAKRFGNFFALFHDFRQLRSVVSIARAAQRTVCIQRKPERRRNEKKKKLTRKQHLQSHWKLLIDPIGRIIRPSLFHEMQITRSEG